MDFDGRGHSHYVAVRIQPAPTGLSLVDERTQEEAQGVLTGMYRSHAQVVRRLLSRRGFVGAELEDVLQEVFVVAWRRLDSLSSESSARAWLMGIAYRVTADVRRRKRRKPLDGDQGLEQVRAPNSDPEQAARHAEAARTVERFLDTLDPDRREAFVLCEVEGFTAPEIATATSTNLNTVYTRIRAGRKAFAEFVGQLQERTS